MLLTTHTLNLTDGSHKKVKIKCDSGKNTKCLNIFEREWRSVIKQRKRIGEKDYCKFCQKTEEFSGRNNPNTKYKYIDDSIFNKIDTKEKAYILGWIASDGSIRESGFTISIRDYDVQIIKWIRDFFSIDVPIVEINQNMVSLTINSKQIAKNLLHHLGLLEFGKKDSLINFPDILEDFHPYFLRGFFEGDGTLNIRHRIPRCSITSNSDKFLKSIQKKVGFGNIYYKTNKWEINSGVDTLRFMNYIYKDQEFPRLQRKYDIYLYIIDWKPAIQGQWKGINTSYGIIRVSKTNSKAIYPEIQDNEASGLDLTIVEKVKDFNNSVGLYTTGLKIQPPTGYYFLLVARSSISKTNFSLANAIGIIDKNYYGEIMVALRKHEGGCEEPKLPLRIVQLIPIKVESVDWVQVNNLEDSDRGILGFGEYTAKDKIKEIECTK